jgi:predicted MPP superfamily phosphohydrolase
VTENATRRFRALFISDVHLGTRGCQADKLLDFLRHHEADTIYLVGDIVDGWALRSSWYWPQAHNDVVQKLLRQARKGARLIYIPGTTTSSCATITARISAASRWWRTPSMKPPTASAIWSCTATCSI